MRIRLLSFFFIFSLSIISFGSEQSCVGLLSDESSHQFYDGPVGPISELEPVNTIFLGYSSGHFNLTHLDILRNLPPEIEVILITMRPHKSDDPLFIELLTTHPNIRVIIDESFHGRVWTRDWVPRKVIRPDGRIEYVSMSYDNTAFASMYLARTLELPFYLSYLSGEMGNIITDGKGRLFTTTEIFKDNIDGYWRLGDVEKLEPEKRRVTEELKKAFSVNDVIFLPPHPADNDINHIDLLIKFVGLIDGKDTFLVTDSTSPGVKTVLDQAAKTLKDLGYNVIRIMEFEKQQGFGAMGFVNSQIINGMVFMPTYSIGFTHNPILKERLLILENEAKRLYESLGFQVFEVNAVKPIAAGGAVHCLSCTTTLPLMSSP